MAEPESTLRAVPEERNHTERHGGQKGEPQTVGTPNRKLAWKARATSEVVPGSTADSTQNQMECPSQSLAKFKVDSSKNAPLCQVLPLLLPCAAQEPLGAGACLAFL